MDPRLNAFAVNLPSVRVSGDYYDLVKTGPNAVAFVIADAMGHGMPAAILMAAVCAGLRMGLMLNEPWAKVFKGLDEIIMQARPESVFVTGLVGQIDLERRELQIVSAGHLAPSMLVGGRPVSLPRECQTRPWGLDFDSPWEVGRVPLGDGDWSILCYTDGVIENERPEDSLNAERRRRLPPEQRPPVGRGPVPGDRRRGGLDLRRDRLASRRPDGTGAALGRRPAAPAADVAGVAVAVAASGPLAGFSRGRRASYAALK